MTRPGMLFAGVICVLMTAHLSSGCLAARCLHRISCRTMPVELQQRGSLPLDSMHRQPAQAALHGKQDFSCMAGSGHASVIFSGLEDRPLAPMMNPAPQQEFAWHIIQTKHDMPRMGC